MAAARRTGGRHTTKSVKQSNDNAKIRAWAQEQGLAVSERGRISAEIRAAYAKAH